MNEADALREKVAALPFWYHRIELPYGIVTPGWAPIDPSAYRIPDTLEGKRVLDIGAWDGYWTFEALKRGAGEVVAIDDFSDHLGRLDKRDRKAWETFDLCRDAFGYSEDVCKRIETSIYDIAERDLGMFDIVFFFGTIYHLRHPLLALDKISAICKGSLYVESAILDDFSPYRGGLGHGYPGQQMVMEFYPGKEYGNNETNWWVPTLVCLMSMVIASGFRGVDGWKFQNPSELALCRGFAKGEK
jgi:tRNA (mo5U34)-methyltransferase